MITAILYREFSGQSLSEVAQQFSIPCARLRAWAAALEDDLPAIKATLKLEPAGAAAKSRGRGRATYYNNPEMVDAVAAIRMLGFRDALRAGSR